MTCSFVLLSHRRHPAGRWDGVVEQSARHFNPLAGRHHDLHAPRIRREELLCAELLQFVFRIPSNRASSFCRGLGRGDARGAPGVFSNTDLVNLFARTREGVRDARGLPLCGVPCPDVRPERTSSRCRANSQGSSPKSAYKMARKGRLTFRSLMPAFWPFQCQRHSRLGIVALIRRATFCVT